ncbi:MAG: hypothetical protein KKB37_17245, partial [Alphaproteobacteria bacterium]|nr:hypothetical protein [Alphaproteobacteria bacterium]
MRTWTEKEMELLTSSMDKPKSELEKLFPDRSWISVKRRRNRLKKGIPYSKVEKRTWSREEEELLAKNIGRPRSELERLFPSRSWHSIKGKKKMIKSRKKIEAGPVRKAEESGKRQADFEAVKACERFMDYNRTYWERRKIYVKEE